MAESDTVDTLPPQLYPTWRCAALALFAMTAGACGMIDFELGQKHHFAQSKVKGDFGTIRFHYADDAEPYTVYIRRVGRGYGMVAPLYGVPEGDHAHITAMHNRERKFFVGVQGKLTF